MRVGNNKVFNLMDTNGRRDDVINALSGYVGILDKLKKEVGGKWTNMPTSPIQYGFYKEAIELSPDVFEKHSPYDRLKELIGGSGAFKKALESYDVEWIREHCAEYADIVAKFDKGIEDRARHYTNSLVKLGFVDNEREVSAIGRLLLSPSKIAKDVLERTLPIDHTNIIYLRQLLKLRVFDNDGERYYSPFNMALFILLKKGRFSEKIFLELVQGLSPYYEFSSVDELIDNYTEGDIVNNYYIDIPEEIKTENMLESSVFTRVFKNQKSAKSINKYRRFYELIYSFNQMRDEGSLGALLDFYNSEKSGINSAFGEGKPLFSVRRGAGLPVSDFIKKYNKLFSGSLNENLYILFRRSKLINSMREYFDTTKRVFKASGIIKFDNGFVELAYRELCECIFDAEIIGKRICGSISGELSPYYDGYDDYEGDINSYFCDEMSLTQIFEYSDEQIRQIETAISGEFSGATLSEIPQIVADRRREEFVAYIDRTYPPERVRELLLLFSDRNNDAAIKRSVSRDATVPTIYEYIVGIAWYYFSGKRIDLLSSLNLTLSADFEPLIHAGGGQGDIVIYEADKVIMLEATLMNANSQKRGEWEPVLRHSVNLKIEEEVNGTGREVTSFFIADVFDNNTINIWRAVAAVPLESSVQKGIFTDNVVIMPINTAELSELMDKSDEYDDIIDRVRELFAVEKVAFDLEWRKKFIGAII